VARTLPKTIATAAVTVAVALTTAACGSSSSSAPKAAQSAHHQNIKIADIFTSNQSSAVAVNTFAKRIDSDKTANMKVSIYPDAQLGEESTLLDDVRDGTIQMAALTTATLETADPELGIFAVPYLMKNTSQVSQYFHSSAGRNVLTSLSSHGLHGLGYIMSGFGELISKTPIRSAANLKNITVRVIPSPFESLTWSALGGSAVSVPTTQLYLALQEGTVSAEDATLTLFTGLKLYEVAHYVTLTRLGVIADAFVANPKFWSTLTSAQQAAITSAVAAGTNASLAAYTPLHNAAVKTLQANGVTVIPQLTDESSTASLLHSKVYKSMGSIVGASVLKEAEKTVGS